MRNIIEKIKPYQDQIFLVVAIVLTGLIGFGLGRLSARFKPAELNIQSTLVNTADLNKVATGPASETKNEIAEKANNQSPTVNREVSVPDEIDISSRKIVGNKNSKIYHYEDCPGALKMKEGNRVYFASALEAKDFGFKPAGNCPGLE